MADSRPLPVLDRTGRVQLYTTMVLIRAFEEAVLSACRTSPCRRPDDIRLSAGREPVAVGLCTHLTSLDALTVAHRPHHLAIACGMALHKLAALTLGLADGDREDRRWQMFDPETDFTSSASIAEGYPPALGRAFAFQQRGSGSVAVAVTDKVAAHQDGFREALDLAKLWSLPLVFVVEDDAWVSGMPDSRAVGADTSTSSDDYGIPADRVESNAVETIYDVAARAVQRARVGEGPAVLELHTARLWEHREGSLPEFDDKLLGAVGPDPLPTYQAELTGAGVLDADQVARIGQDAATQVAEAIAKASEPGPEEAADPPMQPREAAP